MSSDPHSSSASAAATAAHEPAENKMNEEAQPPVEKEIDSSHEEIAASLKDNPASDSTPSITTDEQIDEPPQVAEPQADHAAESQPEEQLHEVSVIKEVENQPPAESTEKGQDEHDEEKGKQVEEPKEAVPVKECVEVPEKDIEEVVEATDKKAQEKPSLERVAQEVQELPSIESAETGQEEHHPKTVDVSESPNEATGKQAEPVDVHPVKDGSVESAEDGIKYAEAVPTQVKSKTTEAEIPEVEAKLEVQPDVSERVETASKEAYESMSTVEAQTEEQPETTGKADSSQGTKVEPGAKPDRTVETEDSVIGSKDEKCSDQEKSSSTESHEQVLLSNDDIVSKQKKETDEASSPAEVVEKVSAEDKEKCVVEEHSAAETKDEKENVSEDKDVVTEEKPEKGENIGKDTEPAAEDKCTETAKEIDTESKEKENAATKTGELDGEKVAKTAETASEVTNTETSTKESSEQKQPEVITKEVSVKPKHSNNIISKVKQSLVKAKKAIIGKSPSSKTLSTEAKGEIKVK